MLRPSSMIPGRIACCLRVRWLSAAASARDKAARRPSREAQLGVLRSKKFDLLVVGGGATGSGIALDAALRGLSVALIDRGDFSCETSSRSTKLIWAGIRYLATATAQLLSWDTVRHPRRAAEDFLAEMKLVTTAHRERRFLLETQPHLTSWLPIAVPIKSWISWPPPFGKAVFAIAPMVLPLVFWVYDGIGGFSSPPSHAMSKARARRKFPQLACWEKDDMKYAAVFYEGVHNDARTALALALTAVDSGAVCMNHCEMTSLLLDEGRARRAICRDNMSMETIEIQAKEVVFAGGPFTDELRRLESSSSKPVVSGAAGTHIVLPGYYAPPNFGMLDINTSDGRFLFLVPWLGSVVIGTTDRAGTPCSSPRPPEEEIEWILKEARKYLSTEFELRRSDVKSAWRGWRPLAVDPYKKHSVSRDHVIAKNPETGVTFVTGGKWTTYREMAQDVVDRISTVPCTTLTKTLNGGEGYSANLAIRIAQRFELDAASAKHLARTYGVHAESVLFNASCAKLHPKYPYVEAEVAYACLREYALTVSDVLTLRTRLAYLDREAAILTAPRVSVLMQEHFKWTEETRLSQLQTALDDLRDFGGPIPHEQDDANGEGFKPRIETLKEARGVAFG